MRQSVSGNRELTSWIIGFSANVFLTLLIETKKTPGTMDNA
jgi:hypothetical protein